jgi:hypothetical protein
VVYLFGDTDYFIILNTMSMPAFQDYGILYDGSKFFLKKLPYIFGGSIFIRTFAKEIKQKTLEAMEKKTRPIGDEFPVTRHNGTAGGTLVILKVVENNDLLCTKCYIFIITAALGGIESI